MVESFVLLSALGGECVEDMGMRPQAAKRVRLLPKMVRAGANGLRHAENGRWEILPQQKPSQKLSQTITIKESTDYG